MKPPKVKYSETMLTENRWNLLKIVNFGVIQSVLSRSYNVPFPALAKYFIQCPFRVDIGCPSKIYQRPMCADCRRPDYAFQCLHRRKQTLAGEN